MTDEDGASRTPRRTILRGGAVVGGVSIVGLSSASGIFSVDDSEAPAESATTDDPEPSHDFEALTSTEPIDDSGTITAPATIDEPGEYTLGDDLSAEGDGLRIDAPDVSIDGQGHRLEGDGTGIGIRVGDVAQGLTVTDLTVRNFENGIEHGLGVDPTYTSVTVEENAGVGILSRSWGFVDIRCEDCTIRENGGVGIAIGDYSDLTVIDCAITENNGAAISPGSSSATVFEDTVAVGNGGPVNFTPTPDSRIEGMRIEDNDGGGLRTRITDVPNVDDRIPVTNCVVRDNDGPGIAHNNNFLEIRGCTLEGNREGYRAGTTDANRAILRNNDIAGNEEYGAFVESLEFSSLVDAECNWWGDESGPTDPDDPREDPDGDRVTDGVSFTPWSVESVAGSAADCVGGVEAGPESGVGYVARKSYRKIMDVGPYDVDCWEETFYVTDPADVERNGFDGPGEITVRSSDDEDDRKWNAFSGHVIRAEEDAVPVTLPTWGADRGDCESLLFADPNLVLTPDTEYRMATVHEPIPAHEDVDTQGFAGTIDALVRVTFEPVASENSDDTSD